MNEKILVKLIDNSNETMVSSYFTTNWSEVYKTYYFMKDNEVTTTLTVTYDENDPTSVSYKDKEFLIEDLSMQFGSKIGLNVLKVYVRVI